MRIRRRADVLLDLEASRTTCSAAPSPTPRCSGCSAARSRPGDRAGAHRARAVPRALAALLLHAPPATPGPIVYDADTLRDGQLRPRRVLARQHGRPIFALTANFRSPRDGLDHQDRCRWCQRRGLPAPRGRRPDVAPQQPAVEAGVGPRGDPPRRRHPRRRLDLRPDGRRPRRLWIRINGACPTTGSRTRPRSPTPATSPAGGQPGAAQPRHRLRGPPARLARPQRVVPGRSGPTSGGSTTRLALGSADAASRWPGLRQGRHPRRDRGPGGGSASSPLLKGAGLFRRAGSPDEVAGHLGHPATTSSGLPAERASQDGSDAARRPTGAACPSVGR